LSTPAPTAEVGSAPRGPAIWVAVGGLVVLGLACFSATVALAHYEITGAAAFTRAAYCTVPGNTGPDGASLPAGTFLDLLVGEPERNPRLAGAYPANFIEGTGLTCSAPPPGSVHKGLAGAAQNVQSGIYPYYVPGG
jgi:hypothetical protein